MESTKEFQEETRRYFDRVAEDYDASYDVRFVRCMYREVVRLSLIHICPGHTGERPGGQFRAGHQVGNRGGAADH